jgi:hypothetical protein
MYAGCSENSAGPAENIDEETGGIQFNITKPELSDRVALVTARLSRKGFDTLKADLIPSEAGKDISFTNIASGMWDLRTEAINIERELIYSGETGVKIEKNATTQVNLNLAFDSAGSGSVEITVSWDGWHTVIFQPGSEAKNAYVDQLYPQYNYSSLPYISLFIGAYITSVIHRQRAFLDFDLSEIPPGSYVSESHLYLYGDYADDTDEFPSGGSVSTLVVERIIGAWEESEVTWSNQPECSGGESASFVTNGDDKQDVKIDVTELVRNYINAQEESRGFRLKYANEDAPALLKFASSNNPVQAIRPKIEVVYREP